MPPSAPRRRFPHLRAMFLDRWKLSLLYVFIAPAIWLQYHTDRDKKRELALFCCSLLACVPLAERLGFATEQLAMHVGDVAAGLINVTFGNAPELIVTYVALGQGRPTIVQDSLLGSILSNLLLVLGPSLFAGGVRKRHNTFSPVLSSTLLSALFLSAIGVAICSNLPERLAHVHLASTHPMKISAIEITRRPALDISRAISAAELVFYFSFLVFSLRTHAALFDGEHTGGSGPGFTGGGRGGEEGGTSTSVRGRGATAGFGKAGRGGGAQGLVRDADGRWISESLAATFEEGLAYVGPPFSASMHDPSRADMPTEGGGVRGVGRAHEKSVTITREEEADGDDEEEDVLGLFGSILWLGLLVFLISWVSNGLVESIDGAAKTSGLSELFISAIILPNVNNAPEHMVSISLGLKDKAGLVLAIALGSATQLALFLLPAAVITDWGVMGGALDLRMRPIEGASYVFAVLVGECRGPIRSQLAHAPFITLPLLPSYFHSCNSL